MTTVIDFETRSVSNIKTDGTYNYCAHPSTEAICLGWKHGDYPAEAMSPELSEAAAGLISGTFPKPPDMPMSLETSLAKNGIVEAHNVAFERTIWNLSLIHI